MVDIENQQPQRSSSQAWEMHFALKSEQPKNIMAVTITTDVCSHDAGVIYCIFPFMRSSSVCHD